MDAPSRNTIVADGPTDGAGIDVGATGDGGGGGATAGRNGGPLGNGGGVPASAVAVAGGDGAGAEVVDGVVAAGGAAGGVAAGEVSAGGGANGVLCTALRGAGDGGVAGAGGAVTAGIEALATGVPAEPDAADGLAAAGVLTPGGGGGGAVPTPNRPGEVVGEDGSARGADCAACCALVRSATRESVSFFSASASGAAGLGGTVEILGYGWSAPGGAGRSSAILPPSWRCHQLTGFNDDCAEHPASSQPAATSVPTASGVANPRTPA